jgi:hypothetical protein
MPIEKPWFSPKQQTELDRAEISAGHEQYTAQESDSHEEVSPLPGNLFEMTQQTFSGEEQEALYCAYARAISRRGRIPLEESRFYGHFFEGGSADQPIAYGDWSRGFLLGCVDSDLGIFTPTHFAPLTMRGGYDLFRDLGESTTIPAVVAITADLEETLSKMPCWHPFNLPKPLMATFHTGEELKKSLMHNEFFNTPDGALLAFKALSAATGDHQPPQQEMNFPELRVGEIAYDVLAPMAEGHRDVDWD